jgi:hypothetical protein
VDLTGWRSAPLGGPLSGRADSPTIATAPTELEQERRLWWWIIKDNLARGACCSSKASGEDQIRLGQHRHAQDGDAVVAPKVDHRSRLGQGEGEIIEAVYEMDPGSETGGDARVLLL